MTTPESEHPFAPPLGWRRDEGTFARDHSLQKSAVGLESRGFELVVHDEDEVRAHRSQLHPELLTRIDVYVWLRRVDEVDTALIEADRVAFEGWIAELPSPRLRSRMTVLAYHARRSSAEARTSVARGPSMGFGRFDGLGILDDMGVHAFRGVRMVGWGFYPLLNFFVLTTLTPRSQPEPRIVWVWGIIALTGLTPMVVVLAWIAIALLRARGFLG